jgi:hypothetical protein
MREANHRPFVLRAWPAVLAVGLLLGYGGCGLDKAQTPNLIGPSDIGVSTDLVAAPDVLNADGVSQSVVRLILRDQDGKPIAVRSVLFTTDGDGYLAPSTSSTFVGPVQVGGGYGGGSNGNGIVMATGKDGVAYVVYVAGTGIGTIHVSAWPYGIDTAYTLRDFRTVAINQH